MAINGPGVSKLWPNPEPGFLQHQLQTFFFSVFKGCKNKQPKPKNMQQRPTRLKAFSLLSFTENTRAPAHPGW